MLADCKFEIYFEQSFSTEYLRNNKTNGSKNLRCFPCCSEQSHSQKGFCGQSVRARLVISASAPIDPQECKSLLIVGEIQPLDETYRPVASGDTEDDIKASAKQMLPRIILGEKTIESCDKGTGSIVLRLEFESKPWFYAWMGSRQRQQTQHCFVVSVLQRHSNSPRGMLLLAQHCSSSFRISCVRRHRASPSGEITVQSESFVINQENCENHSPHPRVKRRKVTSQVLPERVQFFSKDIESVESDIFDRRRQVQDSDSDPDDLVPARSFCLSPKPSASSATPGVLTLSTPSSLESDNQTTSASCSTLTSSSTSASSPALPHSADHCRECHLVDSVIESGASRDLLTEADKLTMIKRLHQYAFILRRELFLSAMHAPIHLPRKGYDYGEDDDEDFDDDETAGSDGAAPRPSAMERALHSVIFPANVPNI